MTNGTATENGAVLALTGHVLITLAEDDGSLLGAGSRTVWAKTVPRSGEWVHTGGEAREVVRVIHLTFPVVPNTLAPDAVSPVVLLRRKG